MKLLIFMCLIGVVFSQCRMKPEYANGCFQNENLEGRTLCCLKCGEGCYTSCGTATKTDKTCSKSGTYRCKKAPCP